LNAVVEIYHEGKTLGSVLCGLVYAHGCALLVCIHVYDSKKNPDGHTRYPENHWDSFFVSPKCGKKNEFDRFPEFKSKGIEFEVGDKCLFQQLTGLLIRQSCQAYSSKPLAR
jgi:rubredoxin